MFDLNSNKLTKLLICSLIIFVVGCSQKSETSRLGVLDASPGIKDQKPLQVNFTVRNKADIEETKARVAAFHRSNANQQIWPRIIDQFSLQEYDNYRIENEVRYLLRNPEFLVNVQKRAEPYLHFIIEEVEAKQLPGEIALLPVIESAFKTHAYSRAHAAGLWQFIPDTGRFFGLKQNSAYDGRRDIYASTAAATRYLRELTDYFDGDVLLALASYNTGKGNVNKAIRRNQENHMATDYWSLNLHSETMAYVPRLLAVAKIFANAEEYNIPLRPIANTPVFTMVDIGSQLDLEKAAELAEISLTELKVLNPAFNRRSSTPKNGPHRLLIPIEKVDTFQQQLEVLPNSKRVKYQPPRRRSRTTRHKVRRGENIGLLAKKYHTSVSAIRRANNMTGSKIYPGKRLKIPSSSQARRYKKSPRRITYRVRRGESLSIIARKHSVSTSNLMRWNKLSRKSVIKPGQRLVMYNAKTRRSSKRIRYTVRKGDSLALISRKFNVSISSLRKWNKLGKYIRPGQKLAVLRPTT